MNIVINRDSVCLAGAVAGPKGWAVRPLKRYASWVQNVVRQFGPYPAHNGVEIMRYWGPVPLYVLAFTQWAGGSVFSGYLGYVGLLFILGYYKSKIKS